MINKTEIVQPQKGSRVVPCQVWSRIVGYLRPIEQWNKGKKQEYSERVNYSMPTAVPLQNYTH